MKLTTDQIRFREAFRVQQGEVYRNAVEHGFHDRDNEKSHIENLGGWTANLHGEVSELWEAGRKGDLFQACDKAEKMEALDLDVLNCAAEELADIVIRAMDVAEALGVDLALAVLTKHAFNRTRPMKHGGKLA